MGKLEIVAGKGNISQHSKNEDFSLQPADRLLYPGSLMNWVWLDPSGAITVVFACYNNKPVQKKQQINSRHQWFITGTTLSTRPIQKSHTPEYTTHQETKLWPEKCVCLSHNRILKRQSAKMGQISDWPQAVNSPETYQHDGYSITSLPFWLKLY